jgi:hypothetical protein
VIEEHPDRAVDDLDKLQADYEAVRRRPQEAHEWMYDQSYISNLTKRLDAANKSICQFHQYDTRSKIGMRNLFYLLAQ